MSWWPPGVVAWWSVDCLQWTVAAGVAWQWSVRCGTASNDGARGTGTMGQLGLQRTAAGCSAWLGHLVRYNVGRWRKRLLWLATLAVVARCEGEATR